MRPIEEPNLADAIRLGDVELLERRAAESNRPADWRRYGRKRAYRNATLRRLREIELDGREERTR